MKVCASCGRENPEDARFCSGCATPLEPAATPREERKVVTVLFCDLVGSTARAERLDPEDVRALLSRYHERVKAELERFGGTVEKFIGDAVMALFGAPVAHEDDPERAVRAALAIREWAEEEDELQVRIGITTGEALVTLGANPREGEGMAAGDVVNTAARLQSAAPENGILVDETTHRATERVVEYAEAPSVDAKGKAAPIAVWEALQPLARFGVDVRQIGRSPFVGRATDLTELLHALERTTEERLPQLVTLVGEPGIGKSRLVWELLQSIRGPELVRWRQGRSLPYGDGVTFWALGEMVKSEAGILETDAEPEAARKLAEAIARVVPDDDRAWVLNHLAPLVGLEHELDVAGDRKAEAFAAWRRYFEALAEERPLVLVFEDLHWADETLLEYVDYLVEWAAGVPLLVVATARPELLARRPNWGGGKPNAKTLTLAPLTQEETTALVHALLERTLLPAEVQSALLERSGGNPLYAEEFARLTAGGRDPAELPETVQGLIAARIDALTPEEKALLQAAAVVGKVFWLDSVVAIEQVPRWTAEERLHGLERKEFVRRERRASVAGETELAFRHVLVRDVTYAQIPRAERAALHCAAAEWIESLGRPEDHAEMLAHHYLAALELARAAGDELGGVADRARLVLREAGDRAAALNAFATAARHYEAALELWPRDAPDRPYLLLALGRAHAAHGEGETVLESALDALVEAGDRESAAEAAMSLAGVLWLRGTGDRVWPAVAQALELVDGAPPSRAKANVVSHAARFAALSGRSRDAIAFGRDALEIATPLGLDDIRSFALNYIGLSRISEGDDAGIDDLEQSIEIAAAIRSPDEVRFRNNLATSLFTLGEPRRGVRAFEEGWHVGARFPDLAVTRFLEMQRLTVAFIDGQWDDALAFAAERIGEQDYLQHSAADATSRILLARGSLETALDVARHSLELGRERQDPPALFPTLSCAAFVAAEAGRHVEASRHVAEFLALERPLRPIPHPVSPAFDIAWALVTLGRADELASAARSVDVRGRWLEAALAIASGDLAAAAEEYERMGAAPNAAFTRLRLAARLAEEGRGAAAQPHLDRALAFYRRAGATAYIAEAEALRAAA